LKRITPLAAALLALCSCSGPARLDERPGRSGDFARPLARGETLPPLEPPADPEGARLRSEPLTSSRWSQEPPLARLPGPPDLAAAPRPPLSEVPAGELEIAGRADGPLEEMLLEALDFSRSGRVLERNRVIRELHASVFPARIAAAPVQSAARLEMEASGGPGDPARVPETHRVAIPPAFRLKSVRFVESIAGPGEYEPRPDAEFVPGEVILIYGELDGYEEVEEEVEGARRFVRRFAAGLRLVDEQARVLDSRRFLPPEQGTSYARHSGEPVNFWAQHRLPPSIEPGRYRMLISAEDLQSGQHATAVLELSVGEEE
jgi:hypothetical protein